MLKIEQIHKERISLLIELAKLRKEVFFCDMVMNENDEKIRQSYFVQEVLDGNTLAWGAFLDEKLVGGSYFYAYKNYLYIEQLFVKKIWQRTENHIGTNLLLDIFSKKEKIESYYRRKLDSSLLYCLDDSTKKFYENLGYELIEGTSTCLKKKL